MFGVNLSTNMPSSSMGKSSSFEGYLLKRSDWLKKWNPRYFRIRGRTLCYYTKSTSKVARGEIPLINATIEAIEYVNENANLPFSFWIRSPVSPDDHRFEIHYLSAPNRRERDLWIKNIQYTISSKPKLTLINVAAQKKYISDEKTSGDNLPSRQDNFQNNCVASSSLQNNGSRRFDEKKRTKSSSDSDSDDDDHEQSKPLVRHGLFNKDFVPPPPPPDASDPLSYLLEYSESSLQQYSENSRFSTSSASPNEGSSVPQSVTSSVSSTPKKSASDAPKLPSPQHIPKSMNEENNHHGNGVHNRTDHINAKEVSVTALYKAIQEGNVSRVTFMLKLNPSLAFVTDSSQQCALHIAAHAQNRRICILLVEEYGANPFVKNRQGDTPISLASPSLAKIITAKFRQKEFEHDDADSI